MDEPLTPAFSVRTPPGEDRPRSVCDRCGFIDYVNPKIVVGAVVAVAESGPAFGPGAVPLEEARVLLCRRAIHPRRGYWTLPAGYMEEGETVADGVRREAREEACADLALDSLLGLYDVPHRSQVHLMFRAALASPEFAAGPESLEVKLFRWADIPAKALAFKSVTWALRDWRASREQAAFAPFRSPPGGDWVAF
jgi:ADP-ribose pyrophosphatase YjhB (NUDIX family)